jgi:hypothetical protein
MSSLLPPRNSARQAITTATNATFSLQLIDESISTGAKQVTPATICNDSFKLTDALALEGAIVASYIFEDAFPYATNKLNHEGAWAQATSLQTSKLIVISFKRSLHFRKDCGIFCEGEWEQQRQLDGHTDLIGFGFIDLVGIVGLICIDLIGDIDFICLVGLVGFIGLFDFIGVIRLLGLNHLVGFVGISCLNDLIGHVSLVGLLGFIRLVDFIGVI